MLLLAATKILLNFFNRGLFFLGIISAKVVSAAMSVPTKLTSSCSFSTFRLLYTVASRLNLRNCESSANHVSSRVSRQRSFENVKISSRSVRRPCCVHDEAGQDRFVHSFVRLFVCQDFSLHRSRAQKSRRRSLCRDTTVGR